MKLLTFLTAFLLKKKMFLQLVNIWHWRQTANGSHAQLTSHDFTQSLEI